MINTCPIYARILTVLLILAGACISGCSVTPVMRPPFYRKGEALYLPGVAGEWSRYDGSDPGYHRRWRFVEGGATNYTVTIRDHRNVPDKCLVVFFKRADKVYADMDVLEASWEWEKARTLWDVELNESCLKLLPRVATGPQSFGPVILTNHTLIPQANFTAHDDEARQWVVVDSTNALLSGWAGVRSNLPARAIFNSVVLSKSIWTTSMYANGTNNDGTANGITDEKLWVGGWGDYYYTYFQFDLAGLPQRAAAASIQLYSYSGPHANFKNIEMYLDRITQSWDYDRARGILRWTDKPASTNVRVIAAPTSNNWYGIDITDLYNQWQSGVYSNYGIALRPIGNWDQFNYFWSSRYTNNPALRPKLVVTPEKTGLTTPRMFILQDDFIPR